MEEKKIKSVVQARVGLTTGKAGIIILSLKKKNYKNNFGYVDYFSDSFKKTIFHFSFVSFGMVGSVNTGLLINYFKPGRGILLRIKIYQKYNSATNTFVLLFI